jgi:hypothetical protein
MAYEMEGITALDPRVAATEQFISEKQISPEQVPDFLMQMGADPKMVGLVFKYQRLKDAAAKQQGPAPTSTVAQDVDQQYAQLQSGLGSLPAPVMENAQFQGGIAPDQEAPPQMMAGGGIVAFSNGGASRLAKSEIYSDAGLEEFIRNNFPGFDALPEAQKRDVARAYQAQYLAAQERAMLRESVDPRMRRDYVAPTPAVAPAAAGIATVAPRATPVPPAAVPTATAAAPVVEQPSAGFIAPDTQGDAFDTAMQIARQNVDQRSPAPAAPAAAATPAAPAAAAANVLTPPSISRPQTLEQITAERIAGEKAAGITNDATKAYEEFLKSREAKIPEEKKAAYKNAWMMTGARLLGSKSPFFAQALGEAAEAGITGYQKDLKEIKAAEQAFKQAGMQLAMNKEAVARGDYRADMAELRRQEDAYNNRELKLYELQTNAREKALDRAMELRVAQLRNATGGDARIARLQALYDATQEPGLSPADKQARQEALARQLEMDRQFTAATTAGGYSADIRSETARAQLLQKVRESFAYRNASLIANNPARPEQERAAARNRMRSLEEEALSGGGNMPSPDYAPRSQTISSGPYSSYSDAQVLQGLGLR